LVEYFKKKKTKYTITRLGVSLNCSLDVLEVETHNFTFFTTTTIYRIYCNVLYKNKK